MTANPAAFTLNAAPFGAYVTGPEQTIRFWSPAAERILGHQGRDVIGRCYCQVLQAAPDESLPPVCLRRCLFTHLARQGRIPPPLRAQMLCASGQRKRVILAPMIIPAEDGRMTLFHLFDELPDDERPGVSGGVAIPSGKAASLTVQELIILRLVADGLTNREIAGSLTLSYHTVRNHVCNIRGKLQARNREEAARIGGNLGLI